MRAIEGLFLQILNMSITAGYVILAILVVRLALKRAPKRFSYALWSVAAFRLISPVSFSSVISLFSIKPFNMTASRAAADHALAYVPTDIGFMQTPQIASGIETADRIINPVLPAAETAASVNPLQIWITAATFAWLAGLLGLLIYGVVSYVRISRHVSHAVRLEGNIHEADGLVTPFVLGLFRPRIYLPFRMPVSERGYILHHEQYHIRRGDHFVKPLSFLLLTVHWFNPLAWVAFHSMTRDMEMSCDEAVLGQMGPERRRDYSASLLALATRQRFPAASPLAFGESNARLRIRNVLGFKRPRTWMVAASLVLCLAVLLACAANPAASGDASLPVPTTTIEPTTAANTVQPAQSPEAELASRFIMDMLDIPNKQIQYAMTLVNPANPTGFEQEMENAIIGLAGGRLADSLVMNAGTSYRNTVIDFHSQAIFADFTIKPERVTVAQNANQKNLYSYEAAAILTESGKPGEPIRLTGRIQFNADGRINFVTIEGSDYKAIWKRYAPRQSENLVWMNELQNLVDQQLTTMANALPKPGDTITKGAVLSAYIDMHAQFGGRMQAEPLDDHEKAETVPLDLFYDQYVQMAAGIAGSDIGQYEVRRLLALAKAGDVQDLRTTIPKDEVLDLISALAARFSVTLDLTDWSGHDAAGDVEIGQFHERYANMAATMARLDAQRIAGNESLQSLQ